MSLRTFLAACVLALPTLPAVAGDTSIMIKDPYARSGTKSGAAFFTIMNHGDKDVRLIGAGTDGVKRVELHTHKEDDNGVMRMREIEGGIVIPAGGMHALKRGGDHVMFMGLDAPFEQGSTIAVTLEFENADAISLDIPVDNDRKEKHGGHGDHSDHKDH